MLIRDQGGRRETEGGRCTDWWHTAELSQELNKWQHLLQTDTSWQLLILNLQVRVPLHHVIFTHTFPDTSKSFMFHLFQLSGFVWRVGKARGETSRSICTQLQGAFRSPAYIIVLPKYHNRTEEELGWGKDRDGTNQQDKTSRTMFFCPLGLRWASEETSMSLLLESLGMVIRSGSEMVWTCPEGGQCWYKKMEVSGRRPWGRL